MSTYTASPVISQFHHDESFIRCVLGPVGSGKSVGMCAEVVRLAYNQVPDADGIRRTRTAIIRNTIKELKLTTIKTFLDWFGSTGTMHWSDLIFTIKLDDVECEILFLGLDRPDQVKSLLSLELSNAFVNEAKEVQPEVIHTVISRLGRYPARKDGVGCTRPCLIMDSNFPSDDSFIYNVFEEDKPEGWKLFKQAGGLSKDAENVENLPEGYYTTMMSGKPEEWLKVYRDAEYGFLMDGKAVWPEYSEQLHLIEKFTPDPKREILIGIDFGRTPVAVFGQRDMHMRWVIFDELQTWDMGATEFAELLNDKILQEYPDYKHRAWGDPAGDDRGQNDDKTPIQILRKAGINIVKGKTQDPFIRVESCRVPMTKIYEGRPAFSVTPNCNMLRKGLGGGYHYKRIQVGGTARYDTKPNKNEYSHVSDALQYLMSSGGEAINLVRKNERTAQLKSWRY